MADGPPDELQTVTMEFREQPVASAALRRELERRLDVTLAGSHQDTGSSIVSTDELLLDAYEATFWRIATLAAVERRSIAIEGALQGSDWLTVCVPSTDLVFAPEPPIVEPRDIWTRLSPRALKRASWDARRPADFFVKPTADTRRSEQRQELNSRFRRSPTANFFADREGPLTERWHEIYGLHANWVELYPTGEAFTRVASVVPNADITDVALEYEAYPVEWQRLLDIPDEAAGLAALNRGADTFTSDSKALRARVMAVLGGSSVERDDRDT